VSPKAEHGEVTSMNEEYPFADGISAVCLELTRYDSRAEEQQPFLPSAFSAPLREEFLQKI